ncbi:MAG: alcohol dehydrogenase catalytic domain-containing protein [Acidobacteria bacterium]|nr:alcohol dehydrogenase catalytic domain-containing protein [Acidobacteriota bacterium]
MRAVVYLEPGAVEVREVDPPEPGPGEVLVRVAFCGICGTDVLGYRVGLIAPDCVMGHEYSGWVEQVGEDAVGIRPNDLVAGNSVLSCGSCPECRRGAANFCEELRILGVNANGALAELVSVPARSLVPAREVPPDELALSEPLSIGVRAWRRAGIGPGEACLIAGAGPIGLLVLMIAEMNGAAPVLVAEVRPARAALAARLGADRVIDPSKESLVAAVGRLPGGGVSALVECTGAGSVLEQAPSLVRPGGRIVPVGICHEPVATDYLTLMTSEIEVRPVYLNAPDDFDAAVSLISSRALDVRPLAGLTVGLEQVPQVLDDLANGAGAAGDAAKVLVNPR